MAKIFRKWVKRLYRNLTDRALRSSGRLIAYDNVTVYRYKIKENEYQDRMKELIDITTGVSCWIDFPSELDTGSANQFFIEDLLPVTAYFPWKVRNHHLLVDIHDEFEFEVEDDLGNIVIYRYQINNKSSQYEESYYGRSFSVSPLRTSSKDMTISPTGKTGTVYKTGIGYYQTTVTPTGSPYRQIDPNIEIGKKKDPLQSIYDDYNNA